MPGGTFVTTGHTSGSAGAGTTACAVADGAPRLPALMVVNAPRRNVRRFIMSGLPQRGCRRNAQLLPRFEAALGAAARLLHDLVRVDRAPQLGDAFDARAGGPLGGNACGRRGCADFVGFAPGQRSFASAEAELAAARSDVDIADAADHGIRIDGNFCVGGEAESGVARQRPRDYPL